MNRKELSLELHHKGYNCAQAVTCAFCKELGLDEQTVFRLSEGYGFGMGSNGTCGAVSGMAMVIGMILSDGNLDNPQTKKQCYSKMREATEAFAERNQSIICRELKGMDTGKPLKSCDGCIEDAVSILEELFPEL